MKMTVEMLYDRLLVRVIGESNRTKSGLWIPDMAIHNTPYQKAEVVEVGHGRVTQNGDTVALKVKAGDVVVFFRLPNSGEQLVFPGDDGEDLLIIREPHVAMILRDLPRASGILADDGKEILVQ